MVWLVSSIKTPYSFFAMVLVSSWCQMDLIFHLEGRIMTGAGTYI
jgi:hypothetical protein